MKALDIYTNSWEDLAVDRTSWRSTLHKQLQAGEEKLSAEAAEKRARRKETTANRKEQDTDATYATVTATLASVYTVTRGAAQAEQTVRKTNGKI